MDKQREECKSWWEEFKSIHPEWKYADADAIRLQIWQAAQTAMQPEIDRLIDSLIDRLIDSLKESNMNDTVPPEEQLK